MKHIKLYENFERSESRLQELCDSYLAYLTDEDFNVYINNNKGSNIPIYDISIRKNTWSDSFNWDEVKDYILPFLEILKDKYELKNGLLFYRKSLKGNEQYREPYKLYPYDIIMNEDIEEDDITILGITLSEY